MMAGRNVVHLLRGLLTKTRRRQAKKGNYSVLLRRRKKCAEITSLLVLQMLALSTMRAPREIWSKPRSVYSQ